MKNIFLAPFTQLSVIPWLKPQNFSLSLQSSSGSRMRPPDVVRGITVLSDTEKMMFRSTASFPMIVVPSKVVSRLAGCEAIKKHTVQRFSNKIKSVIDISIPDKKGFLFDSDKIDDGSRKSILSAVESIANLSAKFEIYDVQIEYDDWPVKSCIDAILPDGLEFSGFSQIGHIIHLNLCSKLLPYKYVIGQLLLDKIHSCKTVVNKLDEIGHNKYRTFKLDLLSGEENYITEVYENKLRYQLNFSQVFYNPRLSTEHMRIVDKLSKRSVFYDCCCGIGPFVLPAVRKGVHHVIANDLNPDSIETLKKNMQLNRLKTERLQIFNMDATDFIKTIIADDLCLMQEQYDSVKDSDTEKTVEPHDVHIVMNLPGLSLEFLQHFRGLLSRNRDLAKKGKSSFPIFIHCHFFVKSLNDVDSTWYSDEGQRLVRSKIGSETLEFIEMRFVRDVARRTVMYCASFQIPDDLLFRDSNLSDQVVADNSKRSNELGDNALDCNDKCFIETIDNPVSKKMKLSNDIE